MNKTSASFETNTRDEFAQAFLTLGHAFNFAALAKNTNYCQIKICAPENSGKSLISDALICAWNGVKSHKDIIQSDKMCFENNPMDASEHTLFQAYNFEGQACVVYFESDVSDSDDHLKCTLEEHTRKIDTKESYPIVFSSCVGNKYSENHSLLITTTHHVWAGKQSKVIIADKRFQTPELLSALPRLVAA